MDESEFKDRMGRLSRIVQANRESGNGPEARQCLCRICGHRWNARTESARPRTCPSCRSSLWDRKELRTVRCYRCGHEWRTSLPHPPRCPSCTSDKWDLKTVAVRCRKCSSVWYDPLSVDKISKCPQCGPVPRDMISPASKNSMTQTMKTNQRGEGLLLRLRCMMYSMEATQRTFPRRRLSEKGSPPSRPESFMSSYAVPEQWKSHAGAVSHWRKYSTLFLHIPQPSAGGVSHETIGGQLSGSRLPLL